MSDRNPHKLIISATISLPSWIQDFENEITSKQYPSDLEKMHLTLKILERQISEKTGGPFSAIIFDPNNWVVSIGLNCVVQTNDSTAHAEIMAIRLGLKILNQFTFSNLGDFTLASSAQPCAQCCGANIWAGIKKLVFAVPAKDSEELLGFDEGPIHPNWTDEYKKRGISVQGEVLKDDAIRIMKNYNGVIYNG